MDPTLALLIPPVRVLNVTTTSITRAMLVAKQRVGLPFDLSSIYSIR